MKKKQRKREPEDYRRKCFVKLLEIFRLSQKREAAPMSDVEYWATSTKGRAALGPHLDEHGKLNVE